MWIRDSVQRGHAYALGLHKVALFLLIQLDMVEEDAFWMLCAIVTRVLPPDFYSRPPGAINGFHADCKVICKLAPRLFRGLVHVTGSEEELACTCLLYTSPSPRDS
eukprot:TRINITY_DN37920_c0_g1_i1.p1 TRINITY_DN37920_c0_g1~~TRINITY_DN37920_c0_g1_i1.p1  ORF type:complete len:106 (+),score=21.62 TRINITY_DN37920_c0_g1_i1:81-398(+)